ncbi:hypothetical protein [Clostridium sp. HBUAS56017]|uniref:hypothetical protein n=1 Tax=Clostridium sp. HBUAS56017 TaxID=2571128 RepID=UPI001177878C|nr:hypothetical protein [Clostridium sp. HBUAS56017]
MENKNKEPKYIRIGAISILIIGIIGGGIPTILFYTKVLNGDQTVSLSSSLAGGAIGCIGTLVAVMLTVYQTNKIQRDNKKTENMKMAFNNMPVFVISRISGLNPVVPSIDMTGDIPEEVTDNDSVKEYVKENGNKILKLNFVIENISSQYAKLSKYDIRAYYNAISLLSSFPNENRESYLLDPELRKGTKEEIGYKEYNYNQSIIPPKESKYIRVNLDVNKNLLDVDGDMYIYIKIKYSNIVGQEFEQELKMIGSTGKAYKTFYIGETLPKVLKS